MSCLRLIGRLVALFIIFILVAVTPPLILAYNAQQTAVSGDFFDELFKEPDLFEVAIPEMAQDLVRNLKDNLETRDLTIARLDANDWERVIYAVAPPEAMQKWSQDAIQSFRRWVRRGGRFPEDVILPFGEIRDNIVNDPDQTVLRTLTEAQPACSDGQEPLGGSNDLIPQCRPPEARREAFYQRLAERWYEQPRQVWQQLMPDDLARYPDNISLADYVESESDTNWWEQRIGWRMSRLGLRAAGWLLSAFVAGQCVIALGLIALFAARSSREALRWVGTPLVLIGVFTLLLAFFLFVGSEIGTWFVPTEQVPIGMQEVLEDTSRAFVNELWPPMSWQGGMLVLIGLGMWVLSFFTPVAYKVPPAPPVHGAVETASPAETMSVEPDASAPSETDLESHESPDDIV
jgi:hypothetical protein